MNGLEDATTLIELFKISPAIIALLVVIFLMYKLLARRDEIIEQIIQKSKEDVERQSKLIALLEILVNRKGNNQ